MLVLALDSATPRITVALARVEGSTVAVLAAHSDDAGNRHGELLAPTIERVLRDAGQSPSDLDAVAVGVGPGPFTGLRVGIVTGASLADASGVPAYAVCSLDAIAHRHRDRGQLLVCTDARRKQVYWARYDAAGGRVEGPEVGVPGDVARRFASEDLTVVGTGVSIWSEALAALTLEPADGWPEAADVARLAADRVAARAPGERLTPMYLRRPDAQPPGPAKRVTPA